MHADQPKTILLSNIDANTFDPAFFKQSIGKKMNILRAWVVALHQQISAVPTDILHPKIAGILVAPEYFFAKNMAPSQVRQYSEDEARSIERELVKLSAQFPQILIIPGTITWNKKLFDKLEDPGVEDYAMQGGIYASVHPTVKMPEEDYIQDKIARGISSPYDIQQIKNRYFQHYQHKQGDHKLLSIKEAIPLLHAYATRGGAPKNDPATKIYTLTQNPHAPNSDKISLSRNTAYFYLGGRQVYRYHKRADFQEVLDHNPNVFIQGAKPPVVNIEGIIFGIEICFDHGFSTDNATGRKKGMLKQLAPTQHIDIHLILSAAVPNYDYNYCMNPGGGYLVHSSSNLTYQRFLKAGQPRFTLTPLNPSIKKYNPTPSLPTKTVGLLHKAIPGTIPISGGNNFKTMGLKKY